MTGDDLPTNRPTPERAAATLGVASAGLLIVGWAWDHRYVPVLFATAPIVAVAGIVFGAIALRHSAHRRSDLLALAGGGLSLLVLLGYAYAVLAYGAGGN